jgi:zinc protease
MAVAILVLAVALSSPGCALFQKIRDAIENATPAATEGDPLDKYQQGGPKTVMKKLDNGLTVVARESFGAPVVAVQVWVNTGSADESDREAGVAHVLEHMMFKGTGKRGVGETAMEVESLGGDLNAFTSYDHTVYHITIASRYFDEAVEILSDLVLNPVFDEGEFKKEREVVLEEIRRGMDNPRSRIWKYLFAKAYSKHTYRRPIIGLTETVSELSRDDVAEFHKRNYVPARMVFVVTGQVGADKAVRAARRRFGGEEPGSADESGPRAVIEPPQKSPRIKVFREDVSEGYMYLGFHVPPYAAQDVPALDVLSAIMGEGETSRLTYRVRTERRLVNNVLTYSYTPKDPGLFMVGCDLTENKLPEALDMILKQLYLLKHEPVEEWELEKAKLSIQAGEIYARETVGGQARQLGFNVTLTGSPEYQKIYMDGVKAVSREDIMRVASKYFLARNLSAAAILPELPEKKKQRPRNPVDESKIHWIITDVDGWSLDYEPGSLTEPEPIAAPEIPVAERTPALSGSPPTAGEPVKYVLKNGIRLIVRENRAVPLVSLKAVFDGGLRRETRELNGINNFIAEAVTEGAAHYSASQIHSFVESRGGGISGFSGRNSLGLNLEVPSPYFNSCLPLWGDVIRYPTFPENDVERIRGIILSRIKVQLDRPASLAFRLFRSELFHEHPFGMDPLGTEKSVQSLTRDDLMDYYQAVAVPGNLVISVVGDVVAEDLLDRMEKLFADWVAEPYAPEPVALEQPPDSPREAVECKEVNQANMVIGFQGTRVTSDDRYAISVLTSVLSGMSGRLFTNLRGEQSLAYSVYALSSEGVDPGYLGVYIGAAPEKESASLDGIMSELQRIREEPISEEELLRARRVLIGEFEIGLQRYRRQAMNYALDELYGLGFRAPEA